MHWEVDKEEHEISVPEDVVDVVFDIACKALPVDNAWLIYHAVAQYLPWIEHEPHAAIHPLRVAESSHGWSRPDAPDELLHLSRRTKLILRIPAERVDETLGLVDKQLDIGGHPMTIIKANTRSLSKGATLTARYLVTEAEEDEDQFLKRQIEAMHSIGVRPKKVLPGLVNKIRTPEGELEVKSLTVEGLSLEDAFSLQRQGLGSYKHLGCGVFIPQKPMSST